MKRAMFSVLAVIVLVGVAGLHHAAWPASYGVHGGQLCPGPRELPVLPRSGWRCRRSGTSGPPLPGVRGCVAAACAVVGAGVEMRRSTPGPATGTITYPYYTNRGPRDFLAKNPPSIGP